jgi:hypothetical protein
MDRPAKQLKVGDTICQLEDPEIQAIIDGMDDNLAYVNWLKNGQRTDFEDWVLCADFKLLHPQG